MTMTLLDQDHARSSVSSAEWLRDTTAAVRVSFTWMGVRKTLTPEQKTQAAEAFGAEGECLSAGKKLLDTKHTAYKDVTAVRGQVLAYWKGCTLPYPEPGVRLLRQDQVEAFHERMTQFRGQLEEAVERLNERYGELQASARRRLGSLFNPADYPATLQGLFGVDWDFPSVEPPDYLLHLSPALYEQERARAVARFDEAVQLAEQAFLGEIAQLVAHLTERLTGTPESERKIFRDSAVRNLTEFFDRFQQLNIRSNPELDALVEQARRIVQGHQPQDLRDNAALRQQVASQLSGVQAALDGLLIDRPRRRIIRAAAAAQGGSHATAD